MSVRHSSEPTVIIRRDKAGMFQRRHPWVFSGAVRAVKGSPPDGGIVALYDDDGLFLGRGYYNSKSQITVHVLTWDDEPISAAFWRSRLARAVRGRDGLTTTTNAYRLVNAESDDLPGLVVDRYGDWLIFQALTAGIERHKAEIAAFLLDEVPGVRGIYERSDVDVREKEGLPPSVGVLWGGEPPPLIEIIEDRRHYLVDVRAGHKTGFYLDQRENRGTLWQMVGATAGVDHQAAEVLNGFGYTGGFAVAASMGGARTVSVDSSAEALVLAKQNLALNGAAADAHEFVVGDMFQVLRHYREEKRHFDVIVLDPPKFAHNKGQIERACRGYKDINLLAFGLLRPGGLLVTFSCSGLLEPELFRKVIFGALIDSGREAQILRRLAAAPDHPVSLTFPEGAYLKGFVCRVW